MNINNFIEKAKKLGVLGFKITQNGQLLNEWYSESEIRRNVYSVTKSFTSIAVGFAVQEGLLSVDEKLVDAFPNDLPQDVSDNLGKATVKDLLTMQLGQKDQHLMAAQRLTYTEDDWVKKVLAIPIDYEPGTHFLYSNVGPYLAGILVQRRAGCNLVDFLLPRLFTPLGIKRPTWETDCFGNSFGSSGLMLSLSEIHKFGLFCLNKGKWDGKQLLDPKWIEQASKEQVSDPSYGYLFWRGEYNSYRADGMFSQLSIVFPDYNAVISVVANCYDGPTLMRSIYDDLCTQF